MDAGFQARVEELATEFASRATTAEELNELMRLMMKSGLERMLNAKWTCIWAVEASPAGEDGRSAKSEPPAPPEGSREKALRTAVTAAAARPCKATWGEVTIATPRDRDGTFRAADHWQAPASRAGLRREDPGSLREGNDDPRHPRDRSGIVRRGGFTGVGVGHHRRPGRGSDRLADPAPRIGVANRLLRRDRRARAGRQRPRVAAHDLRCFGRESGRQEGAAGAVAE